jgi:hypothetical protein
MLANILNNPVTTLHQTRCLNHASREAAARCPECGNFFCRECVTEHHGRILCATCIQKEVSSTETPSSNWLKSGATIFSSSVQFLTSLLFLWLFFYAIGQLLLSIPDSFHSGDLWRGL